MSNAVEKKVNEIRDFMFRFLKMVVPKYPIIFEDQHEPRPTGPFVSFKLLTSFIALGTTDERRWSAADDCFYRIGFREFTVSIKATGSATDGSAKSNIRATSMLGDIQWAFDDPDIIELFRANGIGIVDRMTITDTTELEENVFIPRAVMDVRMSCRISEAISTATIEQVQISGTVKEPNRPDHEIDPFNVEVP